MNQRVSSIGGRTPVSLSIVMPVYNEGGTVVEAVRRLLDVSYPCAVELVIVNDGSTDSTAEELAMLFDSRISVQTHPVNRGKGAAVLTGIEHAVGSHLLVFDADLEYAATDIPSLLAPILARRTDVVFGSRIQGNNTVYGSLRFALGNRLTTWAANLLFDAYLKDLHTCLKLVPLPLLRRMALGEPRFGLDTEITAKLLRAGIRPFEIPVSYFSRSHAEGKKITWKDGVECLRILMRVRAQKVPPLLVEEAGSHVKQLAQDRAVVPAIPAPSSPLDDRLPSSFTGQDVTRIDLTQVETRVQ